MSIMRCRRVREECLGFTATADLSDGSRWRAAAAAGSGPPAPVRTRLRAAGRSGRIRGPSRGRSRRATAVLVDQRSMAQNKTVGRLARELALSTEEVEAVLQRIGAGKRTRLRRLDDAQTRLLAQTIRGLG